MSSKPPIGYLEIRVFAHATEDPEKVHTAVRKIVPDELAQILIFQKSSLTGHHGNSIILFTAKLTDKDFLSLALQKIGRGLNSLDREELCREFKLHLEKRNLYLRFDKQSAFLGIFKFTQNDPIRFKIHFKNLSSEQISDVCTSSGMLL